MLQPPPFLVTFRNQRMKSNEQLEQDYDVLTMVVAKQAIRLNDIENLKGIPGPKGSTGSQGDRGRDHSKEVEGLSDSLKFMFRLFEMVLFGGIDKDKYKTIIKLLNSGDPENVKLAEDMVNVHAVKLHGE